MPPSRHRQNVLLHGLAILALLGVAACGMRAGDFRWQKRFEAFDAADRTTPPGAERAVFVGSSSISGWDLERHFPGLVALNRGLAGASLADLERHADRLVLAYDPEVVVLYGGDNDLADGHAPEAVARRAERLVARIRDGLPRARVLVLSLKPSPRRWSLREAASETNRILRGRAGQLAGVEFVDVASILLDEEGRPRASLFHADGLHLSEAGYAAWTERVTPPLRAALERAEDRPSTSR